MNEILLYEQRKCQWFDRDGAVAVFVPASYEKDYTELHGLIENIIGGF